MVDSITLKPGQALIVTAEGTLGTWGGAGQPFPTNPIAGWDPAHGNWPTPPGGGAPPNWRPEHPEHPIANPFPPYVDAGPPIQPPTEPPPTQPPPMNQGNMQWVWCGPPTYPPPGKYIAYGWM